VDGEDWHATNAPHTERLHNSRASGPGNGSGTTNGEKAGMIGSGKIGMPEG
jgi:hypothetical protein